MNTHAVARVLGLSLLSCSVVGCGEIGSADGKARQAISGTVTLDGQPLPEGGIEFIPVDVNAGELAMAPIAEGKFSLNAEQGPLPGAYSVRINSVEGAPRTAMEALEAPEQRKAVALKNRVAPQFNRKTKLTAQIKAGETAPLTFEVTSK